MQTAKKLSSVSETHDLQNIYDTLNKVQAKIEFNLDGTVINATEIFLKTLGYSLDEIKDKRHRMFCDSQYSSSIQYRHFWDKLNRGELDSGEFKRIGKGGKEVWIQASYNPILDMSGRPFKVVKFATDVTESSSEQIATATKGLMSGSHELKKTIARFVA